jgi:hypothetical protein
VGEESSKPSPAEDGEDEGTRSRPGLNELSAFSRRSCALTNRSSDETVASIDARLSANRKAAGWTAADSAAFAASATAADLGGRRSAECVAPRAANGLASGAGSGLRADRCPTGERPSRTLGSAREQLNEHFAAADPVCHPPPKGAADP